MSLHNTKKTMSFLFMITIFVSTISPFMYEQGIENLYPRENDSIDILDNNELENIDSFDQIKADYMPINDFILSGDNFASEDTLQMNHTFKLELNDTNGLSNPFTIQNTIDGLYTPELLSYNITEITTTSYYDEIDSGIAKEYDPLTNDAGEYITIAQQFSIESDYVLFDGAFMSFKVTNPANLGINQMEFFVVKDSGSLPDLSDIRTYSTNSPFNSTNYSLLNETFIFYDFDDVVLEIGDYYVVANLSFIDSNLANNGAFIWEGDVGTQAALNFRRDHTSTWDSRGNYDYCLAVRHTVSDISGNPLQISDPNQVYLQDNGVNVTFIDQEIIGTGLHTLTSNTSISISFNNNYIYSTIFDVVSSISVVNSTSAVYSNEWTLSWETDPITNPYSNLIRIQELIIPADWNDTFTFFINDTPSINVDRVQNVFEIPLLDNTSALTFDLVCYSPNYVESVDYIDGLGPFTLGYWTNNITHATGYEGSSISVEVTILSILESGGFLNFTVFNTNGEIIPLKTLLEPNLIYNDSTEYSKIGYLESTVFKANTSIDPSANGTDVEGYWTIMCLWQNGTEIGLFTKKVSVIKPTEASFYVEEEVGGNWLEISTTEITRINGEDINIRIIYYNISDPFFSGLGTYISAGNVYYSTSWLESDNLTYSAGNYSYGLVPNITEGSYIIDLFAEGPFLQSHSAQFSLVLLHQFSISVHQSQDPVFYTDDFEVIFALKDITNGSVLISPDTLSVFINGDSLTQSINYSYAFDDDHIVITVYNDILESLPANYELEITVTKENFVESIGVEQTSTTSNYEIIAVADTSVEPITTVSETNTSSQITLTFEWIDETHSEQIKGATIEVSLDIAEPGVEIIENSENDGIYTIIIRINEPETKTLNVRVTASKEGYVPLQGFILATISIKTPAGGLPIAIIVVLSLVAIAGIGVGAFFVTRTQMSKRKEEHEAHTSKARAIFQSAFMIKRILVVHHETSSPIYEYSLDEREELDPSIISGVLQAISSIGAEMSGARTGIKKIEYYNFVVTSASSGAYTIYSFSDTELEVEFEQGLDNLVRWFDVIFGYEASNWEGSMDIFNEYRESINEKVVEELFLWFMFPLQVTPQTVENLDKLKTIDQEIVSFINSKGKATTALIMDQLDEYSNEEILERIMTMVKEEKLKTNNNDAVT